MRIPGELWALCQNMEETKFVWQCTWVRSQFLREKWPLPQNMAVTKAAFQSSRVPREADGGALVLHVEQIFTGFLER